MSSPGWSAPRFLIVMLLTGGIGDCGSTISPAEDDADTHETARSHDVHGDPPGDDGTIVFRDGFVDPFPDAGLQADQGAGPDTGFHPDTGLTHDADVWTPPPGDPATVVCASDAQCAAGRSCCLSNGHCYDPAASPGDCPASPGLDPWGARECLSNAQCEAGQFCQATLDSVCLSLGRCVERTACGTCWSRTGGCAVCGCDGMTYPDIQTACLAGVSAMVQGPCGEGIDSLDDAAAGPMRIGCGHDSQCPGSQRCCLITGSCFDPACTTCCTFPPPGARIACSTSADCIPAFEYCAGTGCDTAGGCMSVPSPGSCTGVLQPVCGCDGLSYTNACWAALARVRVAHDGTCP